MRRYFDLDLGRRGRALMKKLGGAAVAWLPSTLSNLTFWGLDSSAGTPYTRTTNDTARVIDYSGRSGSERQMEPGRAHHYNGSSEYTEVTDHADFDITDHLSVFVRCTNDNATPAADENFFGKWDSNSQQEWAIKLNSSGNLVVTLSSNGTSSGTYTSDSTYTGTALESVGFTFDGGTVVLYVDGSAVAATAASVPSSLHNGTANVTVGCSLATTAATNHWDGLIHDARIYSGTSSSVLSASDMSAIHNDGTVDFANQSLVGHWKCDEGSGSAAYDSSGNGHDGTITGTLSAIHSSNGDNDQYSFQNEVGYSRGTYFEGTTNNYYDLGSRITNGAITALSGACWFNSNQTATRYFFGESGGSGSRIWQVRQTSNGQITIQLSADGSTNTSVSTTGTSIYEDTWTHVAFTYDAGDIKLYINGAEENTGSMASSLFNASTNFKMGSVQTSTMIGSLADVAVEEAVWTPATISAMYSSNTIPSTAWYWPAADGVETQQALRNMTVVGGNQTAHKIPIDQSNTANDIRGIPAQYTGQAPHDAIVNSPCLHLDGSADYVEIADHADFDITDHLSVFVRYTGDLANVPVDEYLISKYDTGSNEREWGLAIGDDEKPFVAFGDATGAFDGSATADSAIDPTAITSLGFTFDGGTVVLYVDGVAVSSTDTSSITSLNNETAPVGLGCIFNSGSAANFLDGILHDARIYEGTSTVLTPAQMQEIHQDATTAFSGQTLVGHWPCVENSGTTIHNTTENDHHGTATLTSEATSWATDQNTYEYLIANGYRVSSGANIPALLDGSSAADGNAITDGPGKLAPGQSLDYTGGEANSPYAQQLNAVTTDTNYVQGDGSDAGDAEFAKTENHGDSKIFTTDAALTGGDLTNADNYVL